LFFPNYYLLITSLPVTNYELPVTSYQLPITSYQLRVTSYELPVTSYKIWAALPVFRYIFCLQRSTYKNSEQRSYKFVVRRLVKSSYFVVDKRMPLHPGPLPPLFNFLANSGRVDKKRGYQPSGLMHLLFVKRVKITRKAQRLIYH
jgi:hypothetical protein